MKKFILIFCLLFGLLSCDDDPNTAIIKNIGVTKFVVTSIDTYNKDFCIYYLTKPGNDAISTQTQIAFTDSICKYKVGDVLQLKK